MRTLSLEEVRLAVRGRYVARGEPMGISGVTTDTRSARGGELFFALVGERFDGHAFLEAAAAAGCAAAVVRQDPAPPREVLSRFRAGAVAVDDTTAALGRLAAWHRRHVPAAVVGVTGSNGKTTVKRMIHHVLARRLRGSCSPKSFNNAVGVPLTLLGVAPGDDYVVCEIGTNAPGEIAALAGMAAPDVAVITSIGPTHLERLGSVEGVAVEKASIVRHLADGGMAVICAGCPPLERALAGCQGKIVRFGEADEADLRLTDYRPAGFAQRFQINGRLWADLPLPGRHNALNALAATAVAQRLGMGREEAAAALADFDGVEMRLARTECGAVTVIDDTYNANPASVHAAAGVLAECEARRRVLVVGDMRELGGDAERLHEQTGRRIASDFGGRLALLVGVGALGRRLAAAAAAEGLPAEGFDGLDELRSALPRLLQAGDTVLLKGSRAMAMETLIEPIRSAFAPGARRPARAGRGGTKR